MGEVRIEQVLVLLIFVLWPLVNLLLGSLRRRTTTEPSTEAPVIHVSRQIQERATSPPVAHPARYDTRAPVSSVSSASVPRGLNVRTTMLGGKRDLRRAMITKTLLGACRANDPPP